MRDALNSVFGMALREQRRALIGFSIGIAGLSIMIALFYPTIQAQGEEMQALIESYPPAMQAFFGSFDDFTSPEGYLRAELFSTMLPLLFLVFAIARASDMLAGQEERGSLEVLLSHPVPRSQVLTHKASAILVGLVGLGFVTWLVILLAGLPFDLAVSPWRLGAAVIHVILLAAALGGLAFAVGAATGRKGLALGVASAIAVAAFVLDSVANIVEDARFLQWASPWHYYADGDPLVNGLDPVGALVLAGLAGASFAFALWRFERRDLAA